MTSENNLPAGFQDMVDFGLVEALMGRRARRFFRGAEIPDGVLAYKSRQKPVPLSELEKILVVTACGGNTGWHHMIYRAKLYAPHLSNYSGAAGGRSFPSAAGFHTSKIGGCSAITWHTPRASGLTQCSRGEEHSRVNPAFWHGSCVRNQADKHESTNTAY